MCGRLLRLDCWRLRRLLLLVLHGANLGLVDSSGRTSLHCAAAAGHSAILKLLLDFGGDVFIEQMNDVGMSCLHLAIQNNRLECVRALLEFAADVDERAMDLATGRRLGKIVALLQAYCAVNARATADLPSSDGGGDGTRSSSYSHAHILRHRRGVQVGRRRKAECPTSGVMEWVSPPTSATGGGIYRL